MLKCNAKCPAFYWDDFCSHGAGLMPSSPGMCEATGAEVRADEVSDRFVASVRAELSPKRSEMTAPRLVTRGGTTYTQDTTNIGRKPKPEPVTPTAPALHARDVSIDHTGHTDGPGYEVIATRETADRSHEQPESRRLLIEAVAGLLPEFDKDDFFRGLAAETRRTLLSWRQLVA